MKAVVFPNLKKDPALSCAREVCDVLQACNITPKFSGVIAASVLNARKAVICLVMFVVFIS